MAGKDLNYRINVNAAAGTAGIRDFSRSVTRELKSVDNALDDTSTNAQKVAQSLGKMADQAEQELKAAARAADALGQALGPELAAEMGRDGIAQKIGDLNRLGLTFDEITADADQLADAVKRIDAVQMSAQDQGLGALGSNAKRAAGEVDGLTASAEKGRNAYANMVGNASQDLGALAGIAGSAGVGLGQLAEGAADAMNGTEGLGSALKGVGASAVPIAGIALAVQAVTDIMGRFSESSKRTAANVDAWSKAMTSGGKAADNYAEQLKDVGDVTVDLTRSQSTLTNVTGELSSHWYTSGAGVEFLAHALGAADEETKSLLPTLNAAGVQMAEWTNIIAGTPEQTARFAASLDAAGVSAEDQKLIMLGLTQQQEDYQAAAEKTEARNKFMAAGTDDATEAFKRQESAVEAERRAHLRNNDALYSAGLRLAEVRTASERAEAQARHTAEAFDAIRASLDMDAAVDDFQVAFLTAIAKVNEGTALTNDDILGLKNSILEVADYADLNPIEVEALLQAIDDGNIRGVMALAQAEINRTKLTAKVELLLAQGQTSTGRIGGIPIARAAPPTDGPAALVAPGGGGTDDGYYPSAGSSYDLGTVATLSVAATAPVVNVDFRGAILTSRYDYVRSVRGAVRDGVRLAGTRS